MSLAMLEFYSEQLWTTSETITPEDHSFSSAGGYLYQYIGSYSAYLEGPVSLIPTFLRKSQPFMRMGRISYIIVTSVLFKLLPVGLMNMED